MWQQHDGTTYSIYASRFSSSSNLWGSAELIEVETGSASFPQISTDKNGNAFAVWRQHDGSADSIYANRYSGSSGLWGSAELIEAEAGSADAPQISADGEGNAIAVWSQHDDPITASNIYANQYSANTGLWGHAELIEGGTGTAYGPQISADGEGNAFAIWYQSDGYGTYDIYANRYSASAGLWSSAELIGAEAGFALSPQISTDKNGNALAAWLQRNGRIFDIQAARFDPNVITP